MEERGGQGIFQGPGIFGKAPIWNTDYRAHEFSHFSCDFDNWADTNRDTECRESVFFRIPLSIFGLQLLFGVAVSSIVIAVCERSRNWDYNGIDYILLITDTGIGFAVFCAAAKK